MKIQCYSVTVENIVFFIQISDSSDIEKTFALLWEDSTSLVARKKITGRLFWFVFTINKMFLMTSSATPTAELSVHRYRGLHRYTTTVVEECQSTAIARQSVLLYNKHGVN